MILEKLTSKKGQISMEIGILVAAAVAVAAIAAYYYTKSVKEGSQDAGQAANETLSKLDTLTDKAREGIPTQV